MAIGSGVLLPGVAENPTFPILSALAYTTGLGYRPTCDRYNAVYSKHRDWRCAKGRLLCAYTNDSVFVAVARATFLHLIHLLCTIYEYCHVHGLKYQILAVILLADCQPNLFYGHFSKAQFCICKICRFSTNNMFWWLAYIMLCDNCNIHVDIFVF